MFSHSSRNFSESGLRVWRFGNTWKHILTCKYPSIVIKLNALRPHSYPWISGKKVYDFYWSLLLGYLNKVSVTNNNCRYYKKYKYSYDWHQKSCSAFVRFGLCYGQRLSDTRESPNQQDPDLTASNTYHMSRFWTGNKVCGQHIWGGSCHTCPLYGPQMPQLPVRGWQHTDKWAKKHSRERRKGKSYHKRNSVSVKGIRKNEKAPLLDYSYPEPSSGRNYSMSWLHYWDDTKND